MTVSKSGAIPVLDSARLRVVLDTNIWLDWLVFHDSGIAPLQAAVTRGEAQIFMSPACTAELQRVLTYPLARFTLSAAQQSVALAQCIAIAHNVMPDAAPHDIATLPRCSDADDQIFLELARDCRADALLTKDRALLAMARRKKNPLPFRIVTPTTFLPAHAIE